MKSSHDRQLRAIVFSDVVDSSLKIFADELIAVQQIKNDLVMLREQVQRHGGSLVKSLGDGLLITFEAPSQALDFIQSVVVRLKNGRRRSLSHRFGLHTGEIYADGDDIIGQGVHLASRLQTVSPVNGVAFVRSTHDLIDPRYRRLAVCEGEMELKGMPEPLEVYTLGPEQLLTSFRSTHSHEVDLEDLLADTSYDLVRPIGRSLQQQTLLLKDRQRNSHAVLKVIPADQQLAEALKLEAATLDRLRHPRIPRVIEVFDRSGMFCFIQEHIPGASLNGSLDWLRRKQRIAGLLRQVLEVLQDVHSVGLVHGDIHPANLIPAAEGDALFLVDFALLRARIDARRLQSGPGEASLSEMGRPYYSAPERARFGRLTPAADLYALGVAVLNLYTGQSPDRLYDQSLGCWSLKDVDPEVRGWLEPLLQDLPAERLQNASDALKLLDQPLPLDGVPASSPISADALIHKERLQTQLLRTYGPMVELLLDPYPSQIPHDQHDPLAARLIAAGLRQDDVQEAIAASRQEVVPSGPLPTQREPEQPTGSDSGTLPRLQLQKLIGPIAELLWTDRMTQAWLSKNSRELAGLLEQAGVSQDSIEQFVACSEPAPEPEAPPLAAAEPVASATPDHPAVSPDAADPLDLEALLIDLVGPIGVQLVADVRALPLPEQKRRLLEQLQSFGVAQITLDQFKQRVGGI